jgi:sugar O-acyltransferase (sialic acid O-acetyltransferase NeuD family)
MNKQPVIIFGASGHAKMVIDIFERMGGYTVVGLLDTFKPLGEEVGGYRILGREENLPELLSLNPAAKVFVAIGDNWTRGMIVEKLRSIVPGVGFATGVHPSVQIGKGVRIGKGVVIGAGAIVDVEASIEDFVIIGKQAIVNHESTMMKFSSLGPNTTTGGNVSIGEFSAIAMSATIKHGVSVGNHTVIGAGALLMHDCGDNLVMYGVPAKEIRSREVGEKYL